MPNLQLPGNPRYQPKDLVPFFGYDNLAVPLVEVEIAALQTLADMKVIAREDMNLLTPEVIEKLKAITMTQIDEVERKVTKHDIRALVRLMQERIPEPLRRWVHVPLTSYDVIDTARALQFRRAHEQVVGRKMRWLIGHFYKHASLSADKVQIGRTHGQHALPITVGFWFATVLSRLLTNAKRMDEAAAALVGKISGAVGAYNAQVALGLGGNLMEQQSGTEFEHRVLSKLMLTPSPISTQILPPEPLAQYLFVCVLASASLAQFGRDSRHLMRTEIAELGEPFEQGQVGSSTMAHKHNPINFENLEGMYQRSSAEFLKVFFTLVSEHQRDLTGSSVARDLPIIVVNLVNQLDTLLRPDKEGRAFIERINVDEGACARNLGKEGDKILAEPMYLALQMCGYKSDAHELINRKAMPLVGQESSLFHAVCRLSQEDSNLLEVLNHIPREVRDCLAHPERYIGRAREKTEKICDMAIRYLEKE